MKTFEWSTRYTIGIEEIDNQHKKLLNIINEMIIAEEENKFKEKLGYFLKEMDDYTKYHFDSEEKYMEKIKYPALAEHKAQHRVLVKKLVKILEDLKEGKISSSQELPDILQKWLIRHVFDHDKQIGLFVKGY